MKNQKKRVEETKNQERVEDRISGIIYGLQFIISLSMPFTSFIGITTSAMMVRALPHVETLNITMATTSWDISRCAFEFGYLAKEHDIQFMPSFGFPNLNNIKVISSSGVCLKEQLERNYEWDCDDLFKLSKFLLKNATVLEKFIIISRRRNCKICSTNCASLYSVRLAEKLFGVPKFSTSCVIISQDGAFHD